MLFFNPYAKFLEDKRSFRASDNSRCCYMQSGLLVISLRFPTLHVATLVRNTAARSPKLARLFISFLRVCKCRVARLTAVSIASDAKDKRRFQAQRHNAHLCALIITFDHINTLMTTYDKLDNEHRAWSVKEAAEFLGYSISHLRRLMREGKMDECWMKAQEDGRPRFCPAKLKVWMEKRSQGNARRRSEERRVGKECRSRWSPYH